MSIISLQVGQCGNQVGAAFFDSIFNDCYYNNKSTSQKDVDYIQESTDIFFNRNLRDETFEARCVQVDMEEKVIRQLRTDACRHLSWRYPKDSFYSGKKGSGNNWAHGFLLNGQACEEIVGDLLRKELEKADLMDGIITTLSLAGGTGSGVGTHLLRSLQDICPKVPVLAQLVWPYQRGEISIQAYNALLSLGHLLARPEEGPDGILMQENDILHQICLKHLGDSLRVPLSCINALMAHQLAGILQPVTSSFSLGTYRRLSSLLYSLAGPPDFCLYRLRCLPYMAAETKQFSTESWPQLFRYGRQLMLTGAAMDYNLDWSITSSTLSGYKRQPLLAFSAVVRGEGAFEVSENSQLVSSLSTGLLSQTALSAFKTNNVSASSRCFDNYSRSLFVAVNGGGLLPQETNDQSGTDPASCLRQVSKRAWELFAAKAYLHQYTQYGLEKETFMDSFAVVQQIIHSYAQLAA